MTTEFNFIARLQADSATPTFVLVANKLSAIASALFWKITRVCDSTQSG